MKIKFSEIGRNKNTWETECNGELCYEWLYDQVKKYGYVMSDNLNFLKTKNGGIVLAGMHTIGKFEKITNDTK